MVAEIICVVIILAYQQNVGLMCIPTHMYFIDSLL